MENANAALLLEKEYGLNGNILRLAGENENYQISTDQGPSHVLKLADEATTTAMIEIEHLAVETLVDKGLNVALPRVIPTRDGRIEALVQTQDGRLIRGRLLEFVPGRAWCETAEKQGTTRAQREHLGETIARMNQAMAPVIHPGIHRTHHWDLASALQHRERISSIPDPRRRAILEQVFFRFQALAAPLLPQLPQGLIHGDINDDNVLVAHSRVAGILDFGDCLANPIICDLAIALAYHTLDEAQPLKAASDIIGAYHRIRPLSPRELTVLFPLVCARLAVSVIISEQRRQIDPDRASWFVSEKRAWKRLEDFHALSPRRATQAMAAQLPGEILEAAFPNPGTAPEDLLAQRKTHIAPSLSLAYERPLKFIRGESAFLFTDQAEPYLDLYNNVCHVGHCHPHVVRAGQEQMAALNTNTRYLYDGLTDYARALKATLPRELDTCFFVNSGTEANELALRLARAFTGGQEMLVVDGAYHGHTRTMVEISPYKFMGKGGTGKPQPWVHVVPLADPYRGPFKGLSPENGTAYGDQVGEIIDTLEAPLAGFITEGLLSCGGQVIPPPNYFTTAFDHVRRASGVCIVDEVQTGFGRTGEAFWAFELQEVIPDIVVMGKPMGNGHPMGAVVCKREIAEAFANGMEFFATFGGNPVSCAVGQAVLEVIETENLQAHAKAMGTFLFQELEKLKAAHPLMGDVRGKGLFAGIELVTHPLTLAPAKAEAQYLVNYLAQHQILTGTDGPLGNVIKLKPPMTVTRQNLSMFLRILDQGLTALETKTGALSSDS